VAASEQPCGSLWFVLCLLMCSALMSSTASSPSASTERDPRRVAHELTQRWLELDNTIRRTNEMVREIRSERNEVGDSLIVFLREQGYTRPSLKLGTDIVSLSETARRPPITIDAVREAMTAMDVQEEVQEDVVRHIELARDENATRTVALSRKKSRQGRRSRTRRAAGHRSENPHDKQ
jgi:seryl-tRNA synthetase